MSEILSTVLSDSQPPAKGGRLARSSRMLALEQRFMFDGALAASAADAASHPDGDRAPEHQAGQIDVASFSDSARIRSYAALVATRFDLSVTTGSGGQTVRQTVDGHTMVLTSTKTIMTVEDESALGADVVGMEGMILLPAGGGDTETKIRISVAGGKIFDLGSLTIFDRNEISQDLKITTDKGTVPLAQQFDASHTWIPSFSGSMYEGVSWVEIEAKDGNEFVWMFDNFVLNNIRLAAATPTVTDGKISITSNGSGTGGAYKIGDTVTARWDNSAAGDNNTSLSGVTMDFSAFGGGAAVSATESGGIWTASYTITAGVIDAVSRNVSVSATNANGTTTTADSSNLTVDNIAPTLTDAKISISGGSGPAGAYKIGDTVTATWNNTAGGDNNSDTVASVTVDFSQFGGGSAVSATNAGGTWSATYTIVAGGIDDVANRNVTVTVKDNAGNQTTVSDTSNARVDNVAPVISFNALALSNDTGDSATDFVTRSAAQTITATLSAAPSGSERVYGSLDNGANWSDITGKVTGTALSWDGVTLGASSTLLLKVKDGAGNEGPLKSQAYTLDSSAPSTPSTPDLDSGSDTGSSNSDNLTNSATPTFSGTADAGSTVTLYDSNGVTELGKTTADGLGKWTITAAVMSAGSHTVTAKASDAAGNVSAASAALTVEIDTTPPASPILSNAALSTTAAASGATVGTLSSSDANAFSFGMAIGNGTNDRDNGRFAIAGGTLKVGASALTAGTYNIYLAVKDAAGNVAYKAFSIAVTDQPTVSAIVRNDSAAVPANAVSVSYTVTFSEAVTGVDAGDFTLTPTGTASGSIAGITTADNKTYVVQVDSLGGDGTLRLDLKASGTGIKNAGNVDIGGGYASGQSYTLDHSAPAAPSVPDLVSGSDSGSADNDNLTSNTTPTFSGTAEANSTVTLYDSNGSTVLGTTTADGAGKWSITATTMSAGSHTVTAKASDAAGNVSAASAALTVEIDVAAPSALVLSSTSIASLAASGATVATLTATDDHAVSYALTSGDGSNDAQNGRFAISGGALKVGATALTAGTYRIYLAATDAAGNISKHAFTITVVDAPSVSSIERSGGVSADVAAGTASVSYTVTFSENVTGVDADDFTLTASGTASGSIASVTAVDGKTYKVLVNSLGGAGALRLDLKSGGTGIKGGGNVDIGGGYSAGQSYTLDRVAPAAPSAPDLAASSDSGRSDSDNITSSTTPTFTGTAEAGSTVKLYDTDGTTVLGSVTADGSGNWSIIATTMSAGSHTVTAKAIDAAGNVSAASAALSVNIDTAAPTALALSANTIALSSAVSAATVATLSATDSNAVSYALASGDGSNDADNARFTLAGNALKVGGTALTAGSYKVYLAATDAAGNVAKQAFVITVTEKPPAPPAPVVASIERSGGAAETVASGAQEIRYTVVFSQEVSGVDAGDFILSASGTAGGSIASVSGSGNTYIVTVNGLSGEGTLRLDLKSGGTGIQNAGKTDIGGGFAAGQSYLLDRVAPPVPSMPDLAAGSDSGSSDSDNLTSSTTPVFTGTAQAGSSVTLYDGGVAIGSAVADAKGNWSITSSPLAAGTHSVTARASDAAGNASAASAALTVVMDTQAPAALSLSASSIALAAAGSNAQLATLSASDSHAVSYALAAGDGANDADNGRFTLSGGALKVGATALTAGSYRIYVAATDAAGNVTKQAFTVTVAAAVAPVVKSIERSGEAAGGGAISYVVTFSENVSGVDAGDFVLTASGSATGTIAAVSGSGSSYIVTVNGVGGEGSLRLDLKGSGTGIQNAGNVALAAGFTSGQSYTVNNVVPPDLQAHLPPPPVIANTAMAPAPAAIALTPPAAGNAIFLSRSTESVLDVGRGFESGTPLQAAMTPLLTMGQGASFQVLLKETQSGAGLMLNRPLADQFVPAAGTMQFSVPSDTFAHSSRDAVIRLSAVQVNGAPIPDWVSFDARSGKFTVRAPAGVAGELQIKVTARDAQGNEATTLLKIRVGSPQQAADAAPRSGRAGLSEQLRAAGRPTLERAVRR